MDPFYRQFIRNNLQNNRLICEKYLNGQSKKRRQQNLEEVSDAGLNIKSKSSETNVLKPKGKAFEGNKDDL